MKTIEDIKKAKSEDNIIENFMKFNGLYCLAARPKVGKSFLALQIANAIANGTDFLGFKTKSSPVLYISTELSASQLKNRIEITKCNFESDNFFFIEKDDKNRLCITDDLLVELNEFANELNGKFVIMDMLYGIDFGTSYDINSYQDMGQLIFPKLKNLCKKFNITILVVHHLGKNGTSLGSTAIDTSVDGIINLSQDDSVKNRYYLTTHNRDFTNLDLILEKNNNLNFVEIKNECIDLDYNLQLLLNYAIRKGNFDFTPSTIINELKLMITPTKFGILLNNNIDNLKKEGLTITKMRNSTSRLYNAKYEELINDND